MNLIFKKVYTARVLPRHLALVLLLVVAAVGMLIYALFPLLLWLLYGEGEIAAKTASLPVVKFGYTTSPLLFAIAFCYLKFRQKSRINNFSKAKTYMITGTVITALYPFRMILIGLVINLCLGMSRW